MTPEDIEKLREAASYYRAYSTSLEKELEQKNEIIGELKSQLKDFEIVKRLSKADLTTYQKEQYVVEILRKNKALKKDNDQLICKIGVTHSNKS